MSWKSAGIWIWPDYVKLAQIILPNRLHSRDDCWTSINEVLNTETQNLQNLQGMLHWLNVQNRMFLPDKDRILRMYSAKKLTNKALKSFNQYNSKVVYHMIHIIARF